MTNQSELDREPQATATPQPGKIYAAIGKIMRAVGPVAKDQRNKEQNYNFRGVEQVYNAVYPHFAEHGVFSTSKILQAEVSAGTSGKGTAYTRVYLRVAFTFWADDGSSVTTEVTGADHGYLFALIGDTKTGARRVLLFATRAQGEKRMNEANQGAEFLPEAEHDVTRT